MQKIKTLLIKVLGKRRKEIQYMEVIQRKIMSLKLEEVLRKEIQ
jgi:hypothetical protein